MTKKGKKEVRDIFVRGGGYSCDGGDRPGQAAPARPPVRSMSRLQIICTIPAQTQSWNTSLRNMVMNLWRQSTEVFNLHDFQIFM